MEPENSGDLPADKGWSGKHMLVSLIVVALIAWGLYLVATSGRTKTPVAQNQAQASQQDVRMNEIKLQRLVRSWVVAGLKDPDSAKFRNQYGVCGEVNAKNAMGGYVGYRRFIAAREDLVFLDDGRMTSPDEFEKVWVTSCSSSPTGSARLPQ